MTELNLVSDNEVQIHTIYSKSERQTDRIIFIVHSYGDTCSRYDWLFQRLNEAGWDVVSYDLSAHGESGGLKGRWKHSEQLTNELNLVVSYYLSISQHKHVVGLGMGLGASLLSGFENIAEKSIFDAFVFWAPLIKLSARIPKVVLDSIKYVNSFTSYMSVINLQPNLFTNKPDELLELIPDWEKNYGKVSAGTASILMESAKTFMKKWPDIKKPVWVAWGEEDRFVDANLFKKHEEESSDEQKTLMQFSGMSHFLEQNEIGNLIVSTMVSWLKSTFPSEMLDEKNLSLKV